MPLERRPLIGLPQAADELGLSYTQVRRLVRAGELAHIRIGTRILIDPADIEQFVNERRTFRVAADVAS